MAPATASKIGDTETTCQDPEVRRSGPEVWLEERGAQVPERTSEMPVHGRNSEWGTLYRIGGIAALAVVALVPVQAVIFILWPPPTTVVEYFAVFQRNAALGLLDLDLLLIVDQLLIILVLPALYLALRRADKSVMLLGTIVGLVGAALFIVSREATFGMLALSQQYAASTAEPERASLVAAGQALLTIYNGTAFSVGYFLSGVAMLLVSLVMLRSPVFSRTTGVAGVLAGATGLVPASFGALGFILSFVSLLPLVVWLTLLGRRLLQLGSAGRR